MRVAAHYVRDGLQISQEAGEAATQVLLPPAMRRLRAGWVATLRVSALNLSRTWEWSRPGLAAARRHARDGAASAGRALLAGLARGRDLAGPVLARAWHRVRVGAASAGDVLGRSQLTVVFAVAAVVALAALALLGYGMWARATGSLADQVAALSLSLAVGTNVAL